MYKRVVLKLSGEALAGDKEGHFDNIVIDQITQQVAKIIENGTEVCIVVGGGNFWRGRSANPDMDRSKADQIGMLATVMNAMYLSDFFKQKGISSVVMTPFKIGTMTEVFSKERAESHLSKNRILIFAGGIGHPFFSTDTITALRASELNADAILFAKSIDGVYDSDPAKNNNSKKFESIPMKQIIEQNLQVIDIAAANLCYEQKIPVIIFALLEKDSIFRVTTGEKIGTVVTV